MEEQYFIISQKKINMIVQIKDALGDRIDPYLERLIQHFLQDDASRFRATAIQDDIAELIEKHDIDVR